MDWRPARDAWGKQGTVIVTAAKFLKNISAKDPTHRNRSRWILMPRRQRSGLSGMFALASSSLASSACNFCCRRPAGVGG